MEKRTPTDSGLTIYRDGRHYDAKYKNFVDDIPFYYGQILKFGEPVLELACGTGRIMIPLARQGVRITGLDCAESMLREARKKAAAEALPLELVRADCREFRIADNFRVIFFPFNSISHLHTPDDLAACLARVKEHLLPEGRFIVDIFNPNLALLAQADEPEKVVAEYPDPDGGGKVTITETHVYDRAAQINHILLRHRFEGREEAVIEHLDQRVFFPQELDALVIGHGFAIEAKYGNFDLSGFASSSPKQILVCR